MSVALHHGDCRDVLATLPAESVQCCVTSPPYFGLRDYGVAGQIGLEQSPAEYVEQMVAVFREVRRVLRKDGTLWLNLGDSYANDGKWGGSSGGKHVTALHGATSIGRGKKSTGLKPKDLMMIPSRVAIALQADGWWVRSEIIWSKAAPMPESVRDRPTCAHEKVWLLTKAASYFYDADAVREPFADERMGASGAKALGYSDGSGRNDTLGGPDRKGLGVSPATDGRNLRNVWHLGPAPCSLAHFATMPPTLAERCIKAGTSEKGCCPACGAPWVRVVERESRPNCTGSGQKHDGTYYRHNPGGGVGNDRRQAVERGWQPSCSCPPHEPVPCTVLDPFAGAGTTLLVADRLQRHGVGIELNPEYIEIARRRLASDAPLFAEVA